MSATITAKRQKEEAERRKRSAAAKKGAETRKRNEEVQRQIDAEVERRLAEERAERNGGGMPPTEPPTAEFDGPDDDHKYDPATVRTDDRNVRFHANRRTRAAAAIAVAAAIVLVLLLIAGTTGTSVHKVGQVHNATPATNSQSGNRLERVQRYWAQVNYAQFRKLARPAVRWHGQGRFIEKGLRGTPVQKLNRFMTATAQDKVSLVGFARVFSNGHYPEKRLAKALNGKQGSPAAYHVWSDLRDSLTGPRSNVRSIFLNGTYQNTGLAENGAVTATPAVYHHERGTSFRLTATMMGGVMVPSHSVKMKWTCSNAQLKSVPSFATPTPTPGKVPPEPKEPGKPHEPGEEPGMHPAAPEGAGWHNAGNGNQAELPGHHYGEPGVPTEHNQVPPPKGTAQPGDQPVPQNGGYGPPIGSTEDSEGHVETNDPCASGCPAPTPTGPPEGDTKPGDSGGFE